MLPQFSSRPLRLRLSALFAVLFTIGAALLIAHIAHRQTVLLGELTRTQASDVAANIAALTRTAVAANDRMALAARLESFNEFHQVRSIVITDRQGEPLAAVHRNVAGNLSATLGREITIGSRPDAPALRGSLRPADDGRPRSIRVAIGQIAPIGWVYLEYDTMATDAARNRLVAGAAVVALLLLCALVTVFWVWLRIMFGAHGRTAPPLDRADGHGRDGAN